MPDNEPLLDVVNLDVAYGDAQALWDLSLTVTEGESVRIMGPTCA